VRLCPRSQQPSPWLYWLVPGQLPSCHVLPYRSVRLLGNRRTVLPAPAPRSTMGLRQARTAVITYVPGHAIKGRGGRWGAASGVGEGAWSKGEQAQSEAAAHDRAPQQAPACLPT
jgi:hypothetical protein